MNDIFLKIETLVNNAKLTQSPYLSKIIPKDKKLLLKTVRTTRPDTINYEDSWGYVIQATRNKGFKWYDPQTGSLVFFGRRSDTDSTLVVPTFLAEPAELARIINIVQNNTKTNKTILKNVNASHASDFLMHGFRHYYDNEKWSSLARYDDQTYPQVIVDLKSLVEAKGREYHPLRKALNKRPNVTVKKYHDVYYKAVLKIFRLNDSYAQIVSNTEKEMYFSSHVMYPTAEIDKFVTIDNATGQIIGFTATSEISSAKTSLVASLFNPGIKTVSIWSIYQTLAEKYYDGIQFASFGGSETASTYNFKVEKFRPFLELKKTHLVYDPQSPQL